MKLPPLFNRLVRDERGQDLIEYALLATFLSLVVIAGATGLGEVLGGWYRRLSIKVNASAGS